MVFNDVCNSAKMLLSHLLSTQGILLRGGEEADRNVVDAAVIEHHQGERL